MSEHPNTDCPEKYCGKCTHTHTVISDWGMAGGCSVLLCIMAAVGNDQKVFFDR